MSDQDGTTSDQSATEAPYVLRGGQTLSPNELQAHLAALVRLENVGVLLGAGASKVLGGKTMDEVWEAFSEAHEEGIEWLEDKAFLTNGDGVNIEELIDAIEIALLDGQRMSDLEYLLDLEATRAEVIRFVVRAAILQPKWWKTPLAIENKPRKLASHRQLLHKLSAARQPGQPSPWVFTTNYDLAVEWAAESVRLKVINGFDGLHRRIFAPHNFDLGYRNILARGEARFGTYGIYLAKLHGSLTWHLDSDGTVTEHSTSYLWPMMRNFLKGKNDDIPRCIVNPGASKYMHTVGFVLGELFRRFTEFLAKPQTCLIINGYSFSDEHLNRVLESGLQNPTLQLVVCIPELSRSSDGFDFGNCSPWCKRLVALESPRVTIIGGGPAAYFDALVDKLPDPVIFDEQSERMREMLRKYREFKNPSNHRDEKGGKA